ncbi:MAG TPA: hypothetical protein VFX88_09435 [Actinomycetota bacterium]|nr:hypothetical protein [Actinomycetota bacterium]
MAWRGQGGRRAKGRRGDQDPELDSTAWLEELEREAAQDEDDEEDWASTLRGRRAAGPPPTVPPPQPPPDPGWSPASDGRGETAGSDGWGSDAGRDDTMAASDPDWSWRPPAGDAFGEPARTDPDPGWDRYGGAADPPDWSDPGSGAGLGEPGGSRGDADAAGGWQSAGVDTPTGAWDPVEPVGREPDYPALFGELYRRSAAQQDPIWEAPPVAEPPPEQGPPDPPAPAWPFEETTQTWEPSDRSFIWPADELPSTQSEWDQPGSAQGEWQPGSAQGEWDQPGSASWLDEPRPAPAPEPDQTAAWPGPGSRPWEEPAPEPTFEPRPSPPSAGGLPPHAGPPPDDWASAIPTDVPAAHRAADPSATQVWRPDEAEAEPGVPLRPRGRRAPGTPAREGLAGTTEPRNAATRPRTVPRAPREAADDLETVRRTAPPDTGDGRWNRPVGERQARAWPRVVALISWIVLLMVLCWYYVFPWLERVLPENF